MTSYNLSEVTLEMDGGAVSYRVMTRYGGQTQLENQFKSMRMRMLERSIRNSLEHNGFKVDKRFVFKMEDVETMRYRNEEVLQILHGFEVTCVARQSDDGK